MQLRPYQRASLDALYSYWSQGGGNGLIVIPTGGGKSIVIATLMRELLDQYPDLRIVCATHSKELVGQNYQELLRLWPSAPAGIYSAGLGRRDARARIVFAGIQSIWRKTEQLGACDLLIVDEAHLISRNANTMYGKFIERLRETTPDMRICGMTATPFRLDDGRLDLGKDRLFDKIVYEANVGDLIEQGYLSPLISKATATRFDLTGVGKRGGEYVAGALEVAVDRDWVTRQAVAELVQFGADRKSWLAFCAGVKHAEHVRDAIRAHNVSCETVTGETPNGERDRIIRQFKDGSIRCLTSVGVLTTGFNSPNVDLLAMLRPTLSCGLYLQMVGRAFRRALGKENALILDYAGNVSRHGPVDTIEVTSTSRTKDDKAEPLAKECPTCHTLIALAARSCPTCGHIFPAPEETPKHEAVADASTSILSKGAPAWIDVDSVRYYRHEKPGSSPSMRVEYVCGFVVHKQWVCLSHQGLARQKAEQWWQRCGAMPIPRSTDEGLARTAELRAPVQIQIRPSGKYFEIVGRRFEARKQEVAA